MSDKFAPNLNDATANYLRSQHQSPSKSWLRRCLELQRTARGLPAVFPTALSAAMATPKEERVYDTANWKRGMVGFSYDPDIPGTAGHIFFVCGRMGDKLITASNDVKASGRVDYVPVDFYTDHWGHKLQFAASYLNGYDFKDEKKPVSVKAPKGGLGEHYEGVIEDLIKVRNRKRDKLGAGNLLVRALDEDVKRMQTRLNNWSKH